LPKDVGERIEKFVLEELPALNDIGKSGKIEKMRGYSSCYKARFGDYRVGLIVRDDIVNVRVDCTGEKYTGFSLDAFTV
jgi:mRNA interferase RelE/StbE